jgi:tetratricopeptide (TPR) repeat protein
VKILLVVISALFCFSLYGKNKSIDSVPTKELYFRGQEFYNEEKYSQAAKYFEVYLKRLQAAPEPNQLEIAGCHYLLGLISFKRKQDKQAIEQFKKAVDLIENFSKNAKEYVGPYCYLGTVYFYQKDYKNAVKYCRKAVIYSEKAHGKNARRTIIAQAALARALYKIEPSKGITELQKAYDIMKERYGPNDETTRKISDLLKEYKKTK